MGAPWANRVVRRAHKGVSESRTWSRTRFWEIGREVRSGRRGRPINAKGPRTERSAGLAEWALQDLNL